MVWINRRKDVMGMLGARIAALRRDAGWSQAELGQRLLVSASAVGMYEQGRREPSLDTLVAMANIFGVTVDYLLTGNPVSPPDQKAVGRMIYRCMESAQAALGTRRREGLTAEELNALFEAVLSAP